MAALQVCDFEMLRCRVNVSRSVTEASGAGLVWSAPKAYERRSVPFPAALARTPNPSRSCHRREYRPAAAMSIAHVNIVAPLSTQHVPYRRCHRW